MKLENQTRNSPGLQHIRFYCIQILIVQPESVEKGLVLNHGKYSWPFEIPLFDYLPPSINDLQSYPYVQYYW